MGTGEDTMRVWGYASGGMCVGVGFLTLVACVFMLVIAKSEVSESFKSNSTVLAAITIVVAISALVVGGVAIWKVYLANQLYLQVSSEAAVGKIAISKNVYVNPGATQSAGTAQAPDTTQAAGTAQALEPDPGEFM